MYSRQMPEKEKKIFLIFANYLKLDLPLLIAITESTVASVRIST